MKADARREPTSGWRWLPPAARGGTLGGVIVSGAWASGPRSSRTGYPRPFLFATLLAAVCFTSASKVTLPISLTNGSTLSLAYAANLIALLLLRLAHAMVIAAAGTWV